MIPHEITYQELVMFWIVMAFFVPIMGWAIWNLYSVNRRIKKREEKENAK